MVTLSTGMLLVLLVAGVITALAMLSVFANVIEHETQLHDLRNRVRELHFNHAMYMAKFRGQISEDAEEGEIEILDDETQEPIEATELPEPQTADDELEPAQARAA